MEVAPLNDHCRHGLWVGALEVKQKRNGLSSAVDPMLVVYEFSFFRVIAGFFSSASKTRNIQIFQLQMAQKG
jgi:hypothetical protein